MNRKLRRTETKRVRPMQPQALATVHGIVDNAVRHHQARRLDEAASGFRRAVALKPDNAVAHLGLGNVLSELGQPDEAIASFRRAIAFKPDYPDPYNNLGALLLEQGQLDEAVACLGRAIELKPDYLDAHNNLGAMLLQLLRLDEAVACIRRVIGLRPDYPDAHYTLAMALLAQGDLAAGWEEYEWRWKTTKMGHYRTFTQPQWRGEAAVGRTLLIHAEQGFGDTIQFCRYASLAIARGLRVIMEVQMPLVRLLRSLPGVDLVVARGEELPPFDLQCAMLSMPLAMETTLATIPGATPYLHADDVQAEVWRTRLGAMAKPGPRIGMAWAGSAALKADSRRSLAPARLAPLFDVSGLHFFSLQKDGPAAPDCFPLTDFMNEVGDFADTAALIANLDLVISVDTAVAHLAAALGKPVWLLDRSDSEWRWLVGQRDSPWYPTLRIYRQPRPGDWDHVLAKVIRDLHRFVAVDSLSPPVKDRIFPELSNGLGKSTAMIANPAESEFTNLARWSDPDALLASWDERARLAAQFVPDGAVVLDIGCGKMALERELPANCLYIPADLVARDARTILCELNTGVFPCEAADADLITLLGVVEYVVNLQGLFRWLRSTGKPVIVTYHPTDLSTRVNRDALGWLNHLSIEGWGNLIDSEGLQVDNVEKISDIQLLFKLSPRKQQPPKAKRVRVLSYLNIGNFGDRLGYHLLRSILPANAEVTFSYFPSLDATDFRDVDLLLLGIGNSLFAPMLTEELQRVIEAVPHTVGIFGTQYRRAIDLEKFGAILSRLSTWYARSEEDILLYGSLARKAVHLGDWLIDAFPMTRPQVDDVLLINDEVWKDLPLDRTIQLIQKHRKVVSTRLHPLLCALTSAELVQYSEQRNTASGEISGKFRSMLMDVFGRTYPENTAWPVDRQKVADYKQKVSHGIGQIKMEIDRLLTT